ncbi:MAG: DUF1549 domain-containing protein [Verrucomicrobiales bacterium]|nr:DUF1549 domain-containing protein [Verrucomicrobiales bacterium]
MNRQHVFSTALALIGAFLLSFQADAREWTRASDGKKVVAAFVSYDGETIELKLATGSTIKVPKDQLVKADIEAAERFKVIGDNMLTKKRAAAIDKALAQNLARNGFTNFNEPLPDDLFARRVYLDIVGRIPTREEFKRFADSARPEKREELIDELLTSEGYASHLFNYFADMYRLHASDFNRGIRMEPYIQWWKDSLAENKSYSKMVTEMITAKGNLGHDPAAGFLLRDAGMEFDAFANFAQVMLAIDISCAQCHDDPFQDWQMEDFYEMAAFFNSTQRTLQRSRSMMNAGSGGMPNAPDGWIEKAWSKATENGIQRDNPNSARQFQYFIEFLGYNLTDVEGREMAVPNSVSDMAAELRGKVFEPKTLTKPNAKKGGKTRREALAEHLVSPDNPRFAMAIANRMWDRAFGRPLVGMADPINIDERSLKEMGQPYVLNMVTQMMRDVDYDLREFMRTLYNTRAYQSLATAEEPDWSEAYYFQGPVLRRMRAEQAWDSMMVLAEGSDIDAKKGRDGSFLRELLNVDFQNDSMEDIWAKYEAWNSNRGARMGSAILADAGALSPTYAPNDNLRASELEQPAPAAHMLDTFGQSDRQITDQHNYDGSVPQVLALMNGSVTRSLTGGNSKLVNDLEELDGDDDKVRGVFHTILSRFPTDDELKIGLELMEEYGDAGLSDLGWALINSPEFLYIQ